MYGVRGVAVSARLAVNQKVAVQLRSDTLGTGARGQGSGVTEDHEEGNDRWLQRCLIARRWF